VRRYRFGYLAALTGLLILFGPVAIFDLLGSASVCRGSISNGRLTGAVRPPLFGENYKSYCALCVLALRTYGHEPAVTSMMGAYAALARSRPDTSFVYGEIGFPWGGRFYPHRTHRNGLSFDFMVPLTEGTLPSTALNRFGYDEEFDSRGAGAAGQIDFAAIAAHLDALDRAARERGGRVRRVFLAPNLQDNLFASDGGAALKKRIKFNAQPSWVRHDDHYHVDFDFPCR